MLFYMLLPCLVWLPAGGSVAALSCSSVVTSAVLVLSLLCQPAASCKLDVQLASRAICK